MRYIVSEKGQNELAKYRVKCSHCSHTIIFPPTTRAKKIICNGCGYYIYKSEKDKFKDLMRREIIKSER